MQVYREIPEISNQARSRPALLSGIASVSEEWTVARHREAAREAIEDSEGPCVLDAGTGMYLNTIILDFPLAPKVPEELREKAGVLTREGRNPRRESRKTELALAGEPETGSVWDGELLYKTDIVYLRPDRRLLDSNIERRSRQITAGGIHEAEALALMSRTGKPPNASVRNSIGVKELMEHVADNISLEEAEQRINIRTRRLARRQMRWFDKLVKTLDGRAEVTVLDNPGESRMESLIKHCMRDII